MNAQAMSCWRSRWRRREVRGTGGVPRTMSCRPAITPDCADMTSTSWGVERLLGALGRCGLGVLQGISGAGCSAQGVLHRGVELLRDDRVVGSQVVGRARFRIRDRSRPEL